MTHISTSCIVISTSVVSSGRSQSLIFLCDANLRKVSKLYFDVERTSGWLASDINSTKLSADLVGIGGRSQLDRDVLHRVRAKGRTGCCCCCCRCCCTVQGVAATGQYDELPTHFAGGRVWFCRALGRLWWYKACNVANFISPRPTEFAMKPHACLPAKWVGDLYVVVTCV